MLTHKRPARGITLVELMVVLAVLVILLSFAVPSYSSYIANSSVRNTAEVFYGAVQRARAEAIRLNVPVELVLTDSTPPAPGADADKVTAIATGTNWIIRTAPTQTGAAKRLIDAKVGAEGGGRAVVVNGGNTSVITFTGLGEITNSAAVTVAFRHATFNQQCNLTDAVRCVNVRVSVGGQARLCEPGQPSIDARSC